MFSELHKHAPNNYLQKCYIINITLLKRHGFTTRSDKTYYIALNYLDRTADLNAERISNITGQLRLLESRVNRLVHCVKQLRADHEQVIVGLYFDGKNIRALASEMHISERTVQRYRNAAIDELAEMYEILSEAGIEPE